MARETPATGACAAFLLLLTALIRLAGAVPANGAGEGMSEEEQMAWLASGVYSFRTTIAGWTLAAHAQLISRWTKETDNFALYRYENGNQCAIAVAGTNSASDMLDNFDGVVTQGCGFSDVHSGYMSEVDDLLVSCEFQDDFLPILNSSNCRGGIHITGHSLGGGVASVLAACANNRAKPYGFIVDKLWTFGAPGVSKKPLTNSLAGNGCFQGGRFWNQDALTMDPIPALSRGLNFVHPMLRGTRLMSELLGGYETAVSDCTSYISFERPNPTDAGPQPLLHLMTKYTQRTNEIFSDSSYSRREASESAKLTIASPEPVCLVNYSYAPALEVAVTRGLPTWSYSLLGCVTDVLVSLVCLVCFLIFLWERSWEKFDKFVWLCCMASAGYSYGDEVQVTSDVRAHGDPPRAMQLLEDGSILFVERVRGEEQREKFLARDPKTCDKGPGGEGKSLPVKKNFCKSHKNRPLTRTASMQYLLFVATLGISRLSSGVTVFLFNKYHDDGEAVGLTWGSANSDWMYFWFVAASLGPVASISGMGVGMVFMRFHDWVFDLAHEIGLVFAAGEGAMVWMENYENSWKLTRYLSLASAGLMSLKLILSMTRYKDSHEDLLNWNGALLLSANLVMLLGFVIDAVMVRVKTTCELNRGGECSDIADHSGLFHLLLLFSVALFFMPVWWKSTRASPPPCKNCMTRLRIAPTDDSTDCKRVSLS